MYNDINRKAFSLFLLTKTLTCIQKPKKPCREKDIKHIEYKQL